MIFILDMFIRVMHRKTAVAGNPVIVVFLCYRKAGVECLSWQKDVMQLSGWICFTMNGSRLFLRFLKKIIPLFPSIHPIIKSDNKTITKPATKTKTKIANTFKIA